MRPIAYALLATLAACSIGSGDGATAQGPNGQRSFAVDGFEKIELTGSDGVLVRTGQQYSVSAEGPQRWLDSLRIEKKGDTLEISRKRNSPAVNGPTRITVTMPRLVAGSVAGSGSMEVDRVSGATFAGSLAGSGDLRVAQLGAEAVDFNIAGSGSARAAGAIRSLEVSIAGSGSVVAPQLTATHAEVSIAGSGDVRAQVNGDAKVNILGSGSADLGQGARCKISKMGSGSAKCGG